MKKVLGDIWIEEIPENGEIHCGFVQQFIDENLAECFHIVPADIAKTHKENPMLVVETNTGLQSINAPIDGHILFFNDKARDFPEQLVEEDVVLGILTIEEYKKRRATVPAKPALGPAPTLNDEGLQALINGQLRNLRVNIMPPVRPAAPRGWNWDPQLEEVEANNRNLWPDDADDNDNEE